jgi:hypothetical protein
MIDGQVILIFGFLFLRAYVNYVIGSGEMLELRTALIEQVVID